MNVIENQIELHAELDGSFNHAPSARAMASAQSASRRTPRVALAGIVLGLSGLCLTAATSDQQFARGLELALQSKDQAAIQMAVSQSRPAPPVSGSEAFWLDTGTLAVPVRPATWTGRSLTAGDRFAFGGEQDRRILEVTDVRQLDATAAAAATAGKLGAAMLLVTLRDTVAGDGAPMRLLVEADAPLAGLTPLGRAPQRDL